MCSTRWLKSRTPTSRRVRGSARCSLWGRSRWLPERLWSWPRLRYVKPRSTAPPLRTLHRPCRRRMADRQVTAVTSGMAAPTEARVLSPATRPGIGGKVVADATASSVQRSAHRDSPHGRKAIEKTSHRPSSLARTRPGARGRRRLQIASPSFPIRFARRATAGPSRQFSCPRRLTRRARGEPSGV
jgi:hypothetical protein